jgi:hypothetical protein
MSDGFRYERSYFLRFKEHDALQDLVQNLADQAFGVEQKLPMHRWLDVGIPKWTLHGDETFTYSVDGHLVASIRIRHRPDKDWYSVVLHNNDIVLDRDLFTTMGLSTKDRNHLTVGCKGVGAKNAIASWVSRHDKKMRHPIVARTGDRTWTPYFTPQEGRFSIPLGPVTDYVESFEWQIHCVKERDLRKLFETVLWLSPPAAEHILFSCAAGQLFRPGSPYEKRIYLYHNFISVSNNACGVNLFPTDKSAITPTECRKNIDRNCDSAMDKHIIDLWKRALMENPDAIATLYDLVGGNTWETAKLAKNIPINIVAEFIRRNGEKAYPATQATVSDVKRKLRTAFDVIVVNPEMCAILVEHLGSPDAILLREMQNAETTEPDEPLRTRWADLMSLIDVESTAVFVNGDERWPFAIPPHNGGQKWIFNAHHFVGDHSRFCLDDSLDCGDQHQCHMQYLVDQLFRVRRDLPFRHILKLITPVDIADPESANIPDNLREDEDEGDAWSFGSKADEQQCSESEGSVADQAVCRHRSSTPPGMVDCKRKRVEDALDEITRQVKIVKFCI